MYNQEQRKIVPTQIFNLSSKRKFNVLFKNAHNESNIYPLMLTSTMILYFTDGFSFLQLTFYLQSRV